MSVNVSFYMIRVAVCALHAETEIYFSDFVMKTDEITPHDAEEQNSQVKLT